MDDIRGEIVLKEQDTKIDSMSFYKEDIRILSEEYREEYYMKRPLLFNKHNRRGSLALLSDKLTGFLKNKL